MQMGYGMKMYHKYRPEILIGTLNYKPKAEDIIKIGEEFYEVLSLEKGKRVCYATYACSQDIYRVTGSYPY